MSMNSRFLILNACFFPFLVGMMLVETMEILSGECVFICLQIGFGIYTSLSIYEASRIEKSGGCSYSVIFLVCQFIGQVFIGNFSYLIGSEEHNSWIYMNKSMLLCYLAVFAMTVSCYMRCFTDWGRQISCHFWPDIQTEKLHMGHCSIVFIVSFSLVIFMLVKGIRGYGNDVLEQMSQYAGILPYLDYLTAGSSMVLYLFFYEYLKKPTMKTGIIFLALFMLEFSVAITSGMKKDTFSMFVCLFMMYYLVKHKINIWLLLLFFAAIFGVYQFIDAYRTALNMETFSGDRLDTFFTVISGLGGSQGLYSDRLGIDEVAAAFFARISLTDALSLIVEYKDVIGLGPDDPTFLQDLLAAPFGIFLPRFLLPFKAMSTYGLWVTHTVMGMPDTVISSSYVTVEGFFYLAGGMLMVPIGFFVLGIILNFCGAICRIEERNPVFVVIFFLIALRIVEPSTPIDVVTGVVRATVIYTLIGAFLMQRQHEKSSG